MTKTFSKIEELLPAMHGWATTEKGQIMAAMVFSLRPQVVCEIGVWGGRSLIPMAMAMKLIGHGKAIAIDAWAAPAALDQIPDEANQKWWSSIDFEVPYKDFVGYVENLGLKDIVDIRRANADDVLPPNHIDILHVDGNHDGDHPLRDTSRFAKNVRVGGFCILDDLEWSGGGVKNAEKWLYDHGFQRLFMLGTGAVYQRMANVL